RGRPGACRHGSPRRVGGGGARSRLAGHGGVVEGLGSRHTRRVAYLHYTRGGVAAAPTPTAEQGSAGVAPAKQIQRQSSGGAQSTRPANSCRTRLSTRLLESNTEFSDRSSAFATSTAGSPSMT